MQGLKISVFIVSCNKVVPLLLLYTQQQQGHFLSLPERFHTSQSLQAKIPYFKVRRIIMHWHKIKNLREHVGFILILVMFSACNGDQPSAPP